MDYKETTVSGSQWQRCYGIDIRNQLGQVPQITLSEEVVTVVNGQTFQQCVGSLNVTFDPAQEIVLLNPVDGTPLGATMTQGQIHVALWSLYMAKAAERDGPVPEPIIDPIEPIPEVIPEPIPEVPSEPV